MYTYKSRDFFPWKKISGLEWESNPHSHISGVMLYQLSYQAPWKQGGGKEGIQVLVLGAHYIRRNFLLRNTPAVTMLGSIPTQVLRFFSKEKISGLALYVYKCYSNDSLTS